MTAEPTRRWVSNGPVRLAVWEYGNPVDRPLLALHGFPESARTWEPLTSLLVAAGRRVIAPDLRGHGESDAPRPVRAYRMDRLLDDIEAVIEEYALAPADVVSHDWGAGLAWLLAERRSYLIRHATILNAPHPAVLRRAIFHDPEQRTRSSYVLRAQIPFLPERRLARDGAAALARLFPAEFYSRATIAHYRRNWLRTGGIRGMLNWYRAAARDRSLRAPRSPISVPLAVVWGRDDPLFSPRVLEDSMNLCTAASVHFLDGCGHAPHREAPAAVAAFFTRED